MCGVEGPGPAQWGGMRFRVCDARPPPRLHCLHCLPVAAPRAVLEPSQMTASHENGTSKCATRFRICSEDSDHRQSIDQPRSRALVDVVFFKLSSPYPSPGGKRRHHTHMQPPSSGYAQRSQVSKPQASCFRRLFYYSYALSRRQDFPASHSPGSSPPATA